MRIGDYQLDADVEGADDQELMGVSGADSPDDVDFVGYSIWYTIGSDFAISNELTDEEREERGERQNKAMTDGLETWYEIEVPQDLETGRDWLLRRMDELGLPAFMAPPKVSAKGAFTRTRDHLVTPRNDEADLDGRTVEFETKRASSDTWHLLANTYFTAADLGQEDGEWKQVTVGVFRYMSEYGEIATTPKIDRDDRMWEKWAYFAQRATEMFAEMKESHIGRDIQKMVNRFTHDWSHTIKFRDGGAVYFVPAQYDEHLDALKTLIEEIGEGHKDQGKDCELKRIPVVNDDERREMVEERAQEYIEVRVEDALTDAMEAVRENEEELTEEIKQEAREKVKQGDSFAAQYNDLLELELSIDNVVDEFRADVEGGVKAEILDALQAEAATDGGMEMAGDGE